MAPVPHRELMRIRIARSEPHRRIGLLDRAWHRRGRRPRPELTLMRVVTLEQVAQCRHELAHPSARAERVEAWQQAFVFEGIRTACNAEVETPVARDVDHAGFARQADRMPERCDHRAGAEANAFGARSKVRKVDEGVRRDREFHRVVFADPRGFEAALFRDLDELGEFVKELPMRRMRVVTLHMEKQREFHYRPICQGNSPSCCGRDELKRPASCRPLERCGWYYGIPSNVANQAFQYYGIP